MVIITLMLITLINKYVYAQTHCKKIFIYFCKFGQKRKMEETVILQEKWQKLLCFISDKMGLFLDFIQIIFTLYGSTYCTHTQKSWKLIVPLAHNIPAVPLKLKLMILTFAATDYNFHQTIYPDTPPENFPNVIFNPDVYEL